jgi:hypothetical protein
MKQLQLFRYLRIPQVYKKLIVNLLLTVILLLAITVVGCKSGSNGGGNSPTTPQSGIDVTGTWNITYTVKSNSCDYGGAPGTPNNMTITLVQNGNQISSPDYAGSSGAIDTSTGDFTLTQNTLLFIITLSGVTDGSTASGEYTLSTARLDTGAACQIVYDFIGTKISTSTKM